MRFDELLLKIPGDELTIRFHDHLTVLTGIGMLERQAIADSILGALTGETDAATLRYTDGEGRKVVLTASGGRAAGQHTDGSPATPILGTVAPDAPALRSLMLLQAGDLGLNAIARGDEPTELREARELLAELTEQLRAAMTSRQSADAVQVERERLDRAIRAAEDGAARREYARILAQLERVRAEASALQSGGNGVDADRHLLATADDARALAARWLAATGRLAEVTTRFAGAELLDEQTLAASAHIPDEPPHDLEVRLTELRRASDHRDQLDRRLHDLAESTLPDPSDPIVTDLARVDQDRLWDAHRRVTTAARHLADAQVSLGGVGGDDARTTAVVDELEAAHSVVEDAERQIERRFLPGVVSTGAGAVAGLAGLVAAPVLLAPALGGAAIAAGAAFVLPRMKLAQANRAEQRALQGASAPSYLAFHIRRVEATVDPDVRERLEVSALEHRLAATTWHDLVGSVDPAAVGHLEAEVRAYDDALRSLGGAADEIEHVRGQLRNQAEPTLARAVEQVLDLTRSYGIADADIDLTDTGLIDRLVHHQLSLGRTARLQVSLEEAEADEQKLGAHLEDVLRQLGFAEGTLEARVGVLDWAVGRAAEREDARARARSREEIEDDLVRLQEDARRLRRPEWATVTAADAEEPDLEALLQRRAELTAAMQEVRAEVDVEHLADRHSAIERRVAALESQYDGRSSSGSPGALADVHQYLLAHLTQAAHAGPHDEPVPVVLDEVFLRVPAERKWDLLDMLRRLGEKTQLIYLSDDPFVAAWGRRRAPAGMITLLEPVPEPV